MESKAKKLYCAGEHEDCSVGVYKIISSCGNHAESIPDTPKGLNRHGAALMSDHSRAILCRELYFLLLYHSMDTCLVNLIDNSINSTAHCSNLTNLSRAL